MGDRFGRRRVYLVGIVWFSAASLLYGPAPSAEWLIAARALQGIASARVGNGAEHGGGDGWGDQALSLLDPRAARYAGRRVARVTRELLLGWSAA